MDWPILPVRRVAALRSLRQAGRFGLVGIANTLVDAFVYFALSRGAVVLVLPQAAAKAAGYLAGVVNSYYWNRRWTFRSQQSIRRTFPSFLLANLAGMGINVLILQAALDLLNFKDPIAVLAATLGAVLWNFLINKYFVFGTAREAGSFENRCAESHNTKDGLS